MIKTFVKAAVIAMLASAVFSSCNKLSLPNDWKEQNVKNLENVNFKANGVQVKVDPKQTWNVAEQGTIWPRRITVEDIPETQATKAGIAPKAADPLTNADIQKGKIADFFSIQTGDEITVSFAQSDAMATITLGVYFYDEDGEMVTAEVFRNVKSKFDSRGRRTDTTVDGKPASNKRINIGQGKAFGFYITVDWNNQIRTFYSEGRLNNSEIGHVRLVTKTTTTGFGLAQKTVTNQYICFEDDPDGDMDYNDIVISVDTKVFEGQVPVIALERDGGPWMLLCEDLGNSADNDFNDAVFIVHRITKDKIRIEYAAGGSTRPDEIFFNEVLLGEIHELFGLDIDWTLDYTTDSKTPRPNWFINTNLFNGAPAISESTWKSPIKSDIKTVDPSLTMANFYRSDNCTGFVVRSNGKEPVEFSLDATGIAPFIICVPATDFKWPAECVSIFDAYPEFQGWAEDHTQNTDWYLHPSTVPGMVVDLGEIVDWEK